MYVLLGFRVHIVKKRRQKGQVATRMAQIVRKRFQMMEMMARMAMKTLQTAAKARWKVVARKDACY